MSKKNVNEPMKQMKNFRLQPEIINKLKAMSELTGESETQLVEQAVLLYLDSVGLERADEYEDRAKIIRAGISGSSPQAGEGKVAAPETSPQVSTSEEQGPQSPKRRVRK